MGRIIEVEGLHKSYGQVKAVQGLDFYVEEGKLFAFLGPNGAGKSTTLDILCTLLKPDKGAVKMDGLTLGRDDAKIRERIGIAFQDGVLDQRLTVRENLNIRARLYPGGASGQKAAIDAAIHATAAESFANRRYEKLSGGQKRRADIARALVHAPKLLFLDEPTTGLDPQTRHGVWETLSGIQKERGTTVFFSTHYMEEAAGADYVLIIDKGQIVARGTPAQLKAQYAKDQLRLRPREKEPLIELLKAENASYQEKDGLFLLESGNMGETLALLNRAAPHLLDFEAVHGTMDDVFLAVTGKEVRDNA